jgi:hypothetical protein
MTNSTPASRSGRAAGPRLSDNAPNKSKPEPKILFQKFFKSVGPRTYAAQVKEAGNGNHFIVLTEGKRTEGSDEVKKTRLFLFSEDFDNFFAMLREMADFVKAHPLPRQVRERREKFWKRDAKKTIP